MNNKTKTCGVDTLEMRNGCIQYYQHDNPSAILAFKCDNQDTFDYIDNVKMFLREQEIFEEISGLKCELKSLQNRYSLVIKTR